MRPSKSCSPSTAARATWRQLSTIAGHGLRGLFLWDADGTFNEVRVDEVVRASGLPPGQAGPAGAQAVVKARLDALGDHVLEPIKVEPFIERIDGVTFGWEAGQHENGTRYVSIEPGNFIASYAPWDGLEYDT